MRFVAVQRGIERKPVAALLQRRQAPALGRFWVPYCTPRSPASRIAPTAPPWTSAAEGAASST